MKILLKRPPAVLLVLAGYVASAFVIPTFAPIAVWDDWVYALVVENLVETGRLVILDPVSPSLVFQALWGAGFSLLFGSSLGVLRFSTVVLFGVSGGAFYLLCRELGLDRSKSSLGSLLYLFFPLAFVLAFTFMTEVPYLALITIGTLFYTRGLVTRPTRSSTLIGSLFSGAAFLVRPHGILVPLGVLVYLLFRRRLGIDRRSLTLVVEVALAPVIIAGAYYVWTLAGGGPTDTQVLFAEGIARLNVAKTSFAVWSTLFRSELYVGLFLLPLVPAAIIALKRALPAISRVRLLAYVAFMWMVGLEVVTWWGSSFSFNVGLDTWLGPHGPGPPDLMTATRPPLVSEGMLGVVAVIAVLSGAIFLLLAMRPMDRDDVHEEATRLIVSLGLLQLVGVLGLALYWTVPFERYLIPLLPFSIVIALRGLARYGSRTRVAWAVALPIAIFSVVGTRDFLVYERAIWKLADRANAMGVPHNQLLSAAARDSYYVWEEGSTHTEEIGYKSAWWVDVWHLPIEGRYVIVPSPLPGYRTLRQAEYSSWLHADPQHLYLQTAEGSGS